MSKEKNEDTQRISKRKVHVINSFVERVNVNKSSYAGKVILEDDNQIYFVPRLLIFINMRVNRKKIKLYNISYFAANLIRIGNLQGIYGFYQG